MTLRTTAIPIFTPHARLLTYVQTPEKTTPKGQRGRSRAKLYEIELSSHLQAHTFPQQRNSASSMRQRHYSISRTSPPMLSHLSNRVWEASMRSSNTTKYVSIESSTISLIYPSQGCKDVEEGLGDLILWLTKLKGSVMTTRTDDNREEAERREQLTRFLLHPHPLDDSSQSPALDP